MVVRVRKFNYLKYESKTIHCRNYKDYDLKALQKDVQEQSWVTYYSFKEPNSAWIYLNSILIHLFDRYAPQIEKKVNGRYCPWLIPGIKSLMNERVIQLRKPGERTRRLIGRIINVEKMFAPTQYEQQKIVTTKN